MIEAEQEVAQDTITPKAQKILITGASSGIGYATAQKFLTDETYALVLLARRREPLDQLQQQHPDRVEVIQADLSDLDGLAGILELFDASQLTHVIHNAATVEPITPISEVKASDLLLQQAVNINAPILLTNLIKQTGVNQCRVLFLSSGAAFAPHIGIGTYSVSKAANEMAFEVFQAERVYRQEQDMFFASLRPGGVKTEITDRMMSSSKSVFPDIEKLKARIAEGGLLLPEQTAEFIYHVMNKTTLDEFERHWDIKHDWNIDY